MAHLLVAALAVFCAGSSCSAVSRIDRPLMLSNTDLLVLKVAFQWIADNDSLRGGSVIYVAPKTLGTELLTHLQDIQPQEAEALRLYLVKRNTLSLILPAGRIGPGEILDDSNRDAARRAGVFAVHSPAYSPDARHALVHCVWIAGQALESRYIYLECDDGTWRVVTSMIDWAS